MNEFLKAYNNIINRRLFYEDIKILNHNYKKILNIKSKNVKEFYDSLIIIDKDEKDDIEILYDPNNLLKRKKNKKIKKR